MIVYGYAKDCYYTGDNTLLIRVRIPNIHGPYRKEDAKGKILRNYVEDIEVIDHSHILSHEILLAFNQIADATDIMSVP